MIDKLEEKNLQQITINQNNEIQLSEYQKKMADLHKESLLKLTSITQNRNLLLEKIKSIENGTRQIERRKYDEEQNNLSQDLEKVKQLLFFIFQNFKPNFDKTISFETVRDFDEKQNIMNCLVQIESMIYKYQCALKKEDSASILKHV